jgi:hypothetical protein
MLSVALHLREQALSPRGIAARLVIAKGKKKCRAAAISRWRIYGAPWIPVLLPC